MYMSTLLEECQTDFRDLQTCSSIRDLRTTDSTSLLINYPSRCVLVNPTDVELRFLCPQDIDQVRYLCKDWFPIDYPEHWYADITSSDRFYSLCGVSEQRIIGLVVAEIKPYTNCNREDQGILSPHFPAYTNVAYILSLGVAKEFRRRGVASLLLDSLLTHLKSPHNNQVKAVYLHVLTSNRPAICFYEKRHFVMHNYLPAYYSINCEPRDGFSYIYYINGGCAPWTLIDYIKHLIRAVMGVEPCSLPKRILQTAHTLVRRIFPPVGRIAQSTATFFS